MPLTVPLAVNTDYLKRIKEIAPAVGSGITQPELDSASASAVADVLTTLYQAGFAVASFTDTTNTPANVIEIIKLLGSARVWARMRRDFSNEVPFEQTTEYGLIEMANDMLARIITAGLLMLPNQTMVVITGATTGKGLPKFQDTRLGINPTKQMVTDEAINNFIDEYGPQYPFGVQDNPYLKL